MASETTIAGPFDDHLATRLMHQRIVVLGQQVDDARVDRYSSRHGRQPCGEGALPAVQVLMAAAARFADSRAAGQQRSKCRPHLGCGVARIALGLVANIAGSDTDRNLWSRHRACINIGTVRHDRPFGVRPGPAGN